MKIDGNLIGFFAKAIGKIDIAMSLDAFKSVKSQYETIKKTLLKWVKYYYENRNLDLITQEESIKIHNILDEIKWDRIGDKNYGFETMLADDILVMYEAIIKMVNNQRNEEMIQNSNR